MSGRSQVARDTRANGRAPYVLWNVRMAWAGHEYECVPITRKGRSTLKIGHPKKTLRVDSIST